MAKQATRDFNLNVAHVEAAVAAYLKPYFPETMEVAGVDLTFPVSQRDGTVSVRVYLSPTEKKEVKQEELPLEEPKPANDNKKKR
jgi:hypothetical protein